jgi:excisionase family DNA binding protein
MPEWVADILRDTPPILTTRELSKLLRMSDRNLRRKVVAGRLKSLKADPAQGGRALFARAEVARFLVEEMAVTR